MVSKGYVKKETTGTSQAVMKSEYQGKKTHISPKAKAKHVEVIVGVDVNGCGGD